MDEIQIAVKHYNRKELSEYYDNLIKIYNDRAWDTSRIEMEIKKDSLFFAKELESKNTNCYKLKQRFDIDWVVDLFPVEFSQATAGNNHYIAY